MIALANDHAGVALKEEIKKLLDSRGLAYKDLGTNTTDSVDYPVYGEAAARAVASGECDRAIIICGTGLGISMAANKVRGIRAAVCTDCFMAEMARRHNNANILALGARVVGGGLALKIVETFLDTEFEGGRHQRRVDLISAIEDRA